jgi:type II secretory pathway pseudopilin PulG
MPRNTFVYIRNGNRKTGRQLTTINSTGFVNSAGFNVFEFVLVLIIFTTLASILIPKFTGLQSDAHKKNVQLSANSLRAAVNIIHTIWQSQGSKNEFVFVKGYERGKVLVGITGWPFDVVDIDISHESHAGKTESSNNLTCRRLWNGLLKDSAPTLESASGKDVFYMADFNQGKCRFRYLLNEDGFRIEYDLTTGQVITFF